MLPVPRSGHRGWRMNDPWPLRPEETKARERGEQQAPLTAKAMRTGAESTAAAAGPRESPRPGQRCAGPSASIAPCSPRSDAASEALISVSRRREPQLTEVGLTRPGASLGIAFGNTLLTPTHEQPGAGV